MKILNVNLKTWIICTVSVCIGLAMAFYSFSSAHAEQLTEQELKEKHDIEVQKIEEAKEAQRIADEATRQRQVTELVRVNQKLAHPETLTPQEFDRLNNKSYSLFHSINREEKPEKTVMGQYMERFCSPEIASKEQFIREVAKLNNIKPEVVVAIMHADSGCGTDPKPGSVNNPGNVGHCDTCGPVSFGSTEDGIRAVVNTLNNKYLWKLTMIGELSCGGRYKLGLPCNENTPFYASSPEHWNNNVLPALRVMIDDSVDEHFKFRTI